jgi:hypothetical protein
MARVRKSDVSMLRVSSKLKKSLVAAGTAERFPSKSVLFEVDEENRGVYLVLKGKVCLSVSCRAKPTSVVRPLTC